jgi:hypothetical protein
MKQKEYCSQQVYDSGGFHSHQCSRAAKIFRKGKGYCSIHDPVKVEEKRAARNAKWDAEWEAKRNAEKKAAQDLADLKAKARSWDAIPVKDIMLLIRTATEVVNAYYSAGAKAATDLMPELNNALTRKP